MKKITLLFTALLFALTINGQTKAITNNDFFITGGVDYLCTTCELADMKIMPADSWRFILKMDNGDPQLIIYSHGKEITNHTFDDGRLLQYKGDSFMIRSRYESIYYVFIAEQDGKWLVQMSICDMDR